MSLLDPNIVVSGSKVKLAKHSSAFEFVDEFGDQGEGVGILDCAFVQVAIVLTGTKGAILLEYKEEWACLGRLGLADVSFLEVLFEELVHGLVLLLG